MVKVALMLMESSSELSELAPGLLAATIKVGLSCVSEAADEYSYFLFKCITSCT